MGLPEDDVEEVDPEAALARILDHEHDAMVVGPGLRPGLATVELVRDLLTASGTDLAPVVLDAEALRSIATMDAWWEAASRPSVLTPHAGEFARLAQRQRTRSRRRRGPRRRRCRAGHRRPATPPAAGARSSCSRAPTRSSRPRTGRWPWPRSRTPPSRAAGPATCWPGRSARCSRRGSIRSPRHASASTSTAWPATACANGSATPACSPRTCPTRWRSPGSDWLRRPSGAGCGAGSGSAPGRRSRRRRGAAGARPGVKPATGVRPPIEDRLAAAGQPPLPRTAWLEIDLEALLANLELLRAAAGPGSPSARS